MGNPGIQATGSWAEQSRYLGLGPWAYVLTLTMGNLEIQVIGCWAGQSQYLGIGTSADDGES